MMKRLILWVPLGGFLALIGRLLRERRFKHEEEAPA